MKTISRIALLLVLASSAFSQAVTTQTTFSAAIGITGPGTSGGNIISLTSCTGTVLPSTAAAGSYLWADGEVMQVSALVSGTIGGSGACTLNVKRGVNGTLQSGHSTNTVVYVGSQAQGTGDSSRPFAGGAFTTVDPAGSCTATSQFTLPIIAVRFGRVWTCPTSGPLSGQWAVIYDPTATFSLTDSVEFVPAIGNCTIALPVGVFSAGGFGAAGNTGFGPIQAGAGAATTLNVPVMQISTTNAATVDQHLYTCHIPLPSRLKVTAGTAISDVVFVYGVQGTALGTQAATLASGLYNGQLVFTKEVFPAPGTGETPSTAGPVRADTGTLVILPSAANANTGLTTVGAFVTQKFQPATPILMNVDLTNFYFSVDLLCQTTTQTTTNTPGFYVHYINVPL